MQIPRLPWIRTLISQLRGYTIRRMHSFTRELRYSAINIVPL